MTDETAVPATPGAIVAAQPPDGARRSEPDPRFLLASERTFLSWNRTALALIAGGVAVVRFVTVGSRAAELIVGLLLICFGAFIAACSHRLWRGVDDAIRADRPLPATRLPHILTAGVLAFALAAIALAVLVVALR